MSGWCTSEASHPVTRICVTPPTLRVFVTCLYACRVMPYWCAGFGMAVANAQHMVAGLVTELEKVRACTRMPDLRCGRFWDGVELSSGRADASLP